MNARAEQVLDALEQEMHVLDYYARNDRFLPRSAADGGADAQGGLLAGRLRRALMNQLDDVRSRTLTLLAMQTEDRSAFHNVAGSRFDIWASTVRDTIEQAAQLMQKGQQEVALAHLRAAANSVNAFGRFQRAVEEQTQQLVNSGRP